MSQINALNWFEIYVSDFDRARTFYTAILGQELELSAMEGSQMAILPCDLEKGVGGALTKMDGCAPGPGGTLVYLNVEGQLDAVLERIPAAGGHVIRPKFPIPPHGFIAIFSDPEGNVVGLHSMS
ncbi:VOC family protein [Actomonas aquatica]|uniref:VOC family protein n=1 Tax=Actomonas aquatica TaxID=2866162 RepID=A0ABZ1C340_9BACT|nr:VOC family protein [Opitutus sp. WL0086]WRQ86020.1 VOC family protein [Opitutus sp. WL0086]